jgi:hypothetical protein
MAAARKVNKETTTTTITTTTSQHSLFHPQLRKTKMCSFFEVGRCRKGESCGFAHGEAELGVLPDLTKTSLCLAWKAGTCTSSAANCRFAHGKQYLRCLPAPKGKESKEAPLLLAKPPGLSVGLNADAETFVPAAALEPRKVQPPAPAQKISALEPMKISSALLGNDVSLPARSVLAKNSVFSQWDSRWEGDTVGGETSSDDGSGSVTSPYSSNAWMSPLAQSTMEDLFAQSMAADQTAIGNGYMDELTMEQLHLSPFFMQALDDEGGQAMADLSGIASLMADLDPEVDTPTASKYAAAWDFGRSPGSNPVSSSSKADNDAPEFSGFSPFSGMDRLW